ncbi:MAG: hypothetical protein LBF68_07010 [Christensenellaceae bacterium]|jgi:hypothetical protein|nr:hypothetical protein [Christensenellaceae bacterium]
MRSSFFASLRQKNKKTIIQFIVVILLIIVLLSNTSTLLILNSEFKLYENYGFIEIPNITLDLNDDEKENINAYLSTRTFEVNNQFGFFTHYGEVDLYNASAILNLLSIVDSTSQLKYTIKDQLVNGLYSIDIDDLTILNLLDYINICNILGLAYDEENVILVLSKHFDDRSNLFFLYTKNDSINIKTVITAHYVQVFGDIYNDKFDVITGALHAYSNYSFALRAGGKTFYNSGGDIIYLLSILNEITSKITSHIKDWYNDWEFLYKFNPIYNTVSASNYADFYCVAEAIDPTYSKEKIQAYYNSLKNTDISKTNDIKILTNFIKIITLNENGTALEQLQKFLTQKVNSFEVMVREIDIISTAYGVFLSHITGFSYDKEKLNNFIDATYGLITDSKNVYDVANLLYYNLILDQIVSGDLFDYDSNEIQKILNDILKSLKYKDNIVYDLETTRKVLEIISSLQSYNSKIKITRQQRSKIKNAVKEYIKQADLYNKTIIDLFYLDRFLNLKLIGDDLFLDIYNKLKINGGNISYLDDKILPDIMTTYMFFTCLERIENFSSEDFDMSFINSLKTVDGLYLPYYASPDSEMDLYSILFGNIIVKSQIESEK